MTFITELNHEKTNNVVSKLVRHKPSCRSTEDCYRLEILDLESRGVIVSCVVKKKSLNSLAVTATWSAPSFSHMQIVGFLMMRLI